jgi:uncharacterized membrane protein YesL
VTTATNVLESRPYLLARSLVDNITLGLLWATSSLLVVTLVPATAALVGVVRDRGRGHEFPLVRHFLRMFRENFRQASLWGLMTLAVLAGAAANLVWSTTVPAPADFALRLAAGAVVVATFSSALYAIPMMVSYRMPFGRLLRSSLLLALGRPLATALGFAILALVGTITYLFPPALLILVAPLAAVLFTLANRVFMGLGAGAGSQQ